MACAQWPAPSLAGMRLNVNGQQSLSICSCKRRSIPQLWALAVDAPWINADSPAVYISSTLYPMSMLLLLSWLLCGFALLVLHALLLLRLATLLQY